MSKLWHLNVNATFLKWMAKVDDSQHHRDFALCSHWFQYTSREPMKEDAGNPLTYKLTNISIVSDCLCSVGLHFKINHKTTTYFAPQLCYMNICFSVIIVKDKADPQTPRREFSWLQSLSVMCVSSAGRGQSQHLQFFTSKQV